MKIDKSHGSGGNATSELINSIFARYFDNEYLNKMEDSAVLPGYGRIAMTTDSFVVDPVFFPGGNIGRLAVCGTVNDLLMSGSEPKYITAGYILEEGLDTDDLETVVKSMAETAKEAGVKIVTGDTKVIEGKGGLIINTAGVGFVNDGVRIGPSELEDGDMLILSGTLGEHHAAILASRMGIENDIKSDAAPLNEMVGKLMKTDLAVHAMRDVTRGGLGTVLNEFAVSSGVNIIIEEKAIPVTPKVRDFCGILGLDPLYMGNEGKMVLSVKAADAESALEIIKNSCYGNDASIIGRVIKSENPGVILETRLGGKRSVGVLFGEGLPRIC